MLQTNASLESCGQGETTHSSPDNGVGHSCKKERDPQTNKSEELSTVRKHWSSCLCRCNCDLAVLCLIQVDGMQSQSSGTFCAGADKLASRDCCVAGPHAGCLCWHTAVIAVSSIETMGHCQTRIVHFLTSPQSLKNCAHCKSFAHTPLTWWLF